MYGLVITHVLSLFVLQEREIPCKLYLKQHFCNYMVRGRLFWMLENCIEVQLSRI